jgi:Glyoxalase-like domain
VAVSLCPDAKALGHFYVELLGKLVTYEAGGVAMIGDDGAQPVMFQEVEQHTAPRWPDPADPQQVHLDVTIQDVDTAERAALDIVSRGIPITEVSRWLCHRNIEATHQIYGHLIPTSWDRARTVIDDAHRAGRRQPPSEHPC